MRLKNKLGEYCERLNQCLPVKSQNDIDSLNNILTEAVENIPGYNLFWHRDIFLDCNGDNEKMRNLVAKTDKVHFEVSDDIEEHIGVIVKYNE